MKCGYRNCSKELIIGEGSKFRYNKQYCNRSCKTQEQTYRKRELKKLQKIKDKNGQKIITE